MAAGILLYDHLSSHFTLSLLQDVQLAVQSFSGKFTFIFSTMQLAHSYLHIWGGLFCQILGTDITFNMHMNRNCPEK